MTRPDRKAGFFTWVVIGALLGSLLLASVLGAAAVDSPTSVCTELVQNGGFEQGSLGWIESSAQGYPLVSDFNSRTGRYSAYLGGVNNADDRISQRIALPADATSITLRAWWYLATAETAGVFDTMTVWLLREDLLPLAQLVQVDNTYPVGMWDQIAADLSAYAGRTVILQFAGLTDESNISDFYVDDVSVSACSPAVTPTATVTRTPDPNLKRIFLPLVMRG